jgi:limonene-1,2-epoxide hydrolase
MYKLVDQGVFEVSDDELLDIRDGFDSGTVISSAMRALRIGETGGEKE